MNLTATKSVAVRPIVAAVGDLIAALPGFWSERRPIERAWYVVAGVLFASGLVHVGILLLTGGSWEGPISLRKAATFGMSFGLTLATVAWASTFVRLGPAVRAVLLSIFTVVCVLETTLVTMQAWRGVPSHFNFETPFDTGVSMSLAAGGLVIVVTGLILAWAALARTEGLAAELRLALRFGFVTLLIAFGTGAGMIATGVTRVRSGHAAEAYASAGFLKPLHGVAMHAILVLPGLAWLLGFTRFDDRTRMRVIRAAVAGYSVLLIGAAIVSIIT